ncbi:MAG: hypothetical protein JSV24_07250 [Bacteroidales bacterium]|nr:MAG: hypothetical protein JSV24_07250 [Bacteroidales bacterium]
MIIENRKTAIKVRFRTFVLTIIFATLVIIIYTTRLLDDPLFGLNKNYYTLILVALFILILFAQYFLNLNFIYYRDEGQTLVFRYYSLRILSSKKNSIEIPKNEFVRFEIRKSALGLKRELYLYQRIKSGIAKYPPIPITSLTRDERKAIHDSLARYVKQ